MVEFCEICGGLMRPSKGEEQNFLVCRSCGKRIPLNKEVIESYTSIKKIDHPLGDEFKNLEKMEDWKVEEIYKKFKESD